PTRLARRRIDFPDNLCSRSRAFVLARDRGKSPLKSGAHGAIDTTLAPGSAPSPTPPPAPSAVPPNADAEFDNCKRTTVASTAATPSPKLLLLPLPGWPSAAHRENPTAPELAVANNVFDERGID